MQALTRREHWDSVHAWEHEALAAPAAAVQEHWLRRMAKRAAGRRLRAYMSSYDEYQLWDVIYPRHMPDPGATVLEIGSAPGEHLVRLSRTFGLVPYGIEYSAAGVDVNRAVFAAHDLDPQNVIEIDFFSEECRARYRGRFDVVVSRGFIEHFENPAEVVDRHLELLRPGGLLIVTIPNLQGINGALTRLFHRELIPMHNLEIMSKAAFSRLFDPEKVRAVACAYVGTFSFYLFNVKRGSRLTSCLAACMKLQAVLNVLFRVCLRDRGAENRFTSPQLMFAGIKA
jgi:2-polyprenyl-3-methyl-5-hydroxy-6-metoxy-1,4-benzoquinol methylase